MSDNMPPLYPHDCAVCTFLGTDELHLHDLYFCPQGTLPTILARFGSEGPEYASGLAVAVELRKQGAQHPLVEAFNRAEQRGLFMVKATES